MFSRRFSHPVFVCVALLVRPFAVSLRLRRPLKAGLPDPTKPRSVTPWLDRETSHNRVLNRLLTFAGVPLFVLLGCFTRAEVPAQEAWPAIVLGSSSNEEKINAALDEKTQLDFFEQPLSDLLNYFEDRHGIQIELDTKALDAVGIGSDTPITRSLSGVSLRSAFRLMLNQLDLDFVIADEVLLITTAEEAQRYTVVHIYNVVELLIAMEPAERLAEIVRHTLLFPPEQRQAGKDDADDEEDSSHENRARRISAFHGLLIVRDTYEGQRQVAHLLEAIRRGLDTARAAPR